MKTAPLLAAGIVAATVSSSLAREITAPFNCKTGTKCVVSFGLAEATGDTWITHLACEWSRTTVNSIELSAQVGGFSLYSKHFFPLTADERTSRVTSRLIERSVVSGSTRGFFTPNAAVVRITLTATTAGANAGNCYVSYE